MKKNFLLIFLFSFIYLNVFAQNDTIKLQNSGEQRFFIENESIIFYTDTTNSIDISQIRNSQYQNKFRNPTKLDINKLNTNTWFKITVKNSSDKIGQWIIAVPDFTHIEYYIIDELGNIEILKAGTLLKASEKQLKNGMYEHVSFSLNAGETKTIYVKAISDIAIKIQHVFLIADIYKYYDETNVMNLIQGIFNGLLLMMFFYSMFMFFMTRQKSYLFYSIYILFIAFAIIALLQYLKNYLFPEFPQGNRYLGFSTFLAYIFYYLFVREFLDTKHNNIKLDKYLKRVILFNLVFAIFIIIITFINQFIVGLLSILFVIFNMIVLLVIVIKLVRRKNDIITKIFTLGSSILFLGTFISATGRLVGGEPEMLLVIYQVSIILEVFIFAVGLSYKYRLAELKIKKSQSKLIEEFTKNELLQTKVNRELEQKVEERTSFISKQKNEIDVLYSEMNHRVKNNLQVILSLIYFKMKEIPDAKNKIGLKGIQNQIEAMSAIHEMFYAKNDSAIVKLDDFIENFIGYLKSLNSFKNKELEISHKIDDIELDISKAITLGQIVSEIITNSVKYAFKNTENPQINIIAKKQNNKILFSIKDNGCGVDIEKLENSKKSTGFNIIKIFARELNSKVEVINNKGLGYSFIF